MSFNVDQLIESYGTTETEFAVELPKGDVLTFRNVSDYVAIKELSKRAKRFARAHLAKRFGGNKQVEQFATTDEDLAVMAFIVADLSVEPKLAIADVLKLARHAAPLVSLIGTEISSRLTIESAKAETEELDELGED